MEGSATDGLVFEIGSYYVTQACLTLATFLPQPLVVYLQEMCHHAQLVLIYEGTK